MAQEAVNSILQAFQNSLQMRMARDQSIKDTAEKEKEFALREKQFKAQQEQLDIQNKAAAAAFELQKKNLETIQAAKDLEDLQTKGQARAGVQVIPGVKAPEQPPTQIQIPQINQSTPVFGQPQVGVGSVYPGLSDQGQQKPLVLSDLQKSQLINEAGQGGSVLPLSQRPDVVLARQQAQEAEASAMRKQQFLQRAEEVRQLNVMKATQEAEKQRTLETLAQENIYKKEQIADQLKGQKDLAEIRGKSQLEVARLRQGGGLENFAGMPNAEDVLTRLKIGTYSQEEVNRSPFKKQISQYALENGIQILPQAKSTQIQAIETMANMLPTIKNMIINKHLNPYQVNNPFSDAGKDFAKDAREIRAAAPQASVATTGVRRFTQEELKRFDEFFIPAKLPGMSSTAANMSQYDAFVSNLNQAFLQITKGLPKEQVDAIRANLQSKGLKFMTPEEVPPVVPEAEPSKGGTPPNFNVKVGSRLFKGDEPKVQLGPVKAGPRASRYNSKTNTFEPVGGQQ